MRGRRGHDNQWQRQQNRIPKINKPELIELLEDSNLLPAIFFIFSRAACEASVQECLGYNIRLTTAEEKNEIRALVEHRCREIADEDLATLGYFDWLSALERGVAAHHAGMLPAFKEVVEELFLKKLVKVVFATETLALGINMPARTVVLDRLDKFNGQSRVQITPGEYTQLTGRAGRRGIDVEGHSVVQWSANLDPQQVAGLASRRTYPLISSFKPTYNMTVNLIEAFGQHRAREVLEMSFAQFQADRSVVGLAKGLRDREVSLAGYAKSMECHLGNFHDYASMRREISDLERELAAGRVRHERGKDIRQTKGRHERERRLADLKRAIKTHPCHSCNEREAHARWGERWFQLRRETDNLMAQIEGRTNQVAKTFDRICQLLVEMEYLRQVDEDFEVTDAGKKLSRIYGERDLLVAESLRRDIWKDCDPATLAAIATALVYESRRDDEDLSPKLPRGAFAEAMGSTNDLWDEIEYLAKAHKLPSTSEPDISLCFAMHRWASGATLDKTLDESNLLPGDFIRLTKQVIDLLDQVAQCAEGSVATSAREAIDRVKRGIVAYSYFD
jgi:ATP-dependent RNA helicase HelY